MLTTVPGTFPAGLGEPLNVIISGNSDADVLKDQETDGGLRNYFLSFGYASECLGQHLGDDQAANLGDGNGLLNETAVIRWDFGDPQLGACKESINGGAHFRYWVQDGDSADSGAVFIAASYELPIAKQHDIIFNGYNLGRDWMIGNVTNQTALIDTATVSNTSTFSGRTMYANYTYQTDVSYQSGILQNTSDGVNHFQSVAPKNGTAQDGLVAVMQVKIVSRPAVSSAVSIIPTPSLSSLVAFALAATSCHLLSFTL